MNYKGPIEGALSTDLRGEPYNFSLWDIHTGAQIVAFKGIKSTPIANCVQIIDNNYFITANDNVLHFWSIYNRRSQDQKLFLPSRPSCLCVSQCGQYLIVGIAEMIYIWQLHSGNLLAHTQRHYQNISTLSMNAEGTLLFSAGEDGMVLVWSFADLVSNSNHLGLLKSKKSNVGNLEPKFTWQYHSGPVTDLHITNGGRCLSTSLDSTINIYSYVEGKRLYSISLPTPLTAVTLNKNETRVYVGGQDGNIYELAVSSISLSLNSSRELGDEATRKPMFVGHKAKVTGLMISIDGSRLVSASHDSTCKLWDINSRKLLNDIRHQAPIANLKYFLIPEGLSITSLSNPQYKPPLSIKPLKRNVYKYPRESTLSADDLFEEAATTIIWIKNSTNRWESADVNVNENQVHNVTINGNSEEVIQNGHKRDVMGDDQVIRNLKRKVQELYEFSTEKIFKDAHALKIK